MEGDAGASRLTPNDTDEGPSLLETPPLRKLPRIRWNPTTRPTTRSPSQTPRTSTRSQKARQKRTTRAAPRVWAAAGSSVSPLHLWSLAGGLAAAGYFVVLRSHHDSQATARRDAAAVEAAKDCVGATQAPDIGAMASSAQKIVECGAGAFRSQAILYSGMLVEAYQAANAHVQVSDLRAAVERNNPDGSVEILVPLRVKISNAETQNQEAGYRLRVTMVLDEGKYRISKLDQVAR